MLVDILLEVKPRLAIAFEFVQSRTPVEGERPDNQAESNQIVNLAEPPEYLFCLA